MNSGELSRPYSAMSFRGVATVVIAMVMLIALLGVPRADAGPNVVLLDNDDFKYGTYIIDKPGTYRLAEDISFNPNSPETLTEAAADPATAWMAGVLGWPSPVDAYSAGMPLFTQLAPGGTDDFSPGGLLDAQYDPAAYGVGFFAAISISADDVVLDLNGHKIEQSAEHALLQRFFSVIELADQPFIPNQGPSGFGDAIDSATNVSIRNGVIGRSSHHGIHGNGNENIRIVNVDFSGYEVGAVALNGVQGLDVINSTATNRKDVPVLGTYSSGRFIQAYVDHLVHSGSPTTLTVAGTTHTAADIQAALRDAINNVHEDVIVDRHTVDGRAIIDATEHPDEYALFHNKPGIVDGNSYSYLVNTFGVAVNGFPSVPDGVNTIPSRNVRFVNVHVENQLSSINEVVAIDAGVPSGHGSAAIDAVGAVFQVRNLHPDTGVPVTVTSADDSTAEYTGNVVANAQALVAKAAAHGDFATSPLDISRLNIPPSVVDWVEGEAGSETLAAIGVTYLCNGDSMFHVNKGAIGFKMDGASGVVLANTSVHGLVNHGLAGSSTCGDYSNSHSHPAATLYGYGGAAVRGYSFSGSEDVRVVNASAHGLNAYGGTAIGFDVMTNSSGITLSRALATSMTYGWVPPNSPTATPEAIGFKISADAEQIALVGSCADATATFLDDASGNVSVRGGC